jgi:hypothetical protein
MTGITPTVRSTSGNKIAKATSGAAISIALAAV